MTATTSPSALPINRVADQLAAALTEVGLPVHTPDPPSSAGSGVRIATAADGSGVHVSWEVEESLADDETRVVQRVDVLETMNLALGDLLTILGWDAHPWSDGEFHLIVGRRPLTAGRRAGTVFRG
jgi:hypothetical protein